MGIGSLLGIGKEIVEPVKAIGDAVDKIFTSDEERLTRAEAMEKLKQQPLIAQQLLNQVNANSKNRFDSGWRPYLGWVCGAAITLYYIPQFALATFLWVKFSLAANAIQPYPISAESLMNLVYTLLGVATLRSVDKYNGVAK